MQTFYVVEQKYYDSGKVTATITEIKADEKPENYFAEAQSFDLYRDHFETEEEAKNFKSEALKA